MRTTPSSPPRAPLSGSRFEKPLIIRLFVKKCFLKSSIKNIHLFLDQLIPTQLGGRVGFQKKKTIFNTITSTVTILHYVQPNILLMAHLATPLLIEDIEVDPEQHEVPQPKGYEQRKSAHQPVHELFLYKRLKGEKKNRASKELSLG
jgi:hypothetical protein